MGAARVLLLASRGSRAEVPARVVIRRSPHDRDHQRDFLQVQLADERNAWIMQPDGTYLQCSASNRAPRMAREGSHATLMKRTRQRVRR